MDSEEIKRYTITAALPYANGPLHIGHIAGAYLPADTFVRFLRMKEKDVAFVCGSDEHGAAITIKARKEGVTPQQVIDKFHEINKKAFKDFGISFDIYHRTSAKIHHETSQDFFTILNEKGEFEIIESEQYFDKEAEQFLADRYITGTCPKCGHESAYGDQCENCGSSLSPTELIDPVSTITGSKPVLKKTKHWYLPMQKHEGWIKKWIEEGLLDGKNHHDPKAWKNHVIGQCKSWIDGGLQSRAMTRDLDWGIKVPLENAKGKVLYVWLDAPIGYISATKEWAEMNGKDWELYWKDEKTKLIHFIGKDNIVFHCIIFPIVLKAYGNGFLLPDNVPANEFLNLEGNKLSTSRNWAVWVHEYLKDFPGKQDVLRYVLTTISPENKDSEFTWKDFQAKNNNELVAILGNFVNRTMVLTHKYFNGEVPVRGELVKYDQDVIDMVAEIPEKVESLIMQYKFREALAEAIKLARIGNKYLADTEPWKLFPQDPEIVKTILNICLQITANLGVVLQPFLPDTAERIQFMLGVSNVNWKLAGKMDILFPYDKLGRTELLFNKIEDTQVQQQVRKLEKAKLASIPATPAKEPINFDDFSKMDIRIGTILHAEKVAKTKKLLKFKIDTGIDTRTVVSGIAEYFTPEEIVGMQVSILVNLAPREIKGIVSEGMILMSEDRDGSLSFVIPRKKVNNGSIVR
ncbi:MAG: methionine--tRNA ligase [Bacteroidota bacterium]